MNKIFDIIQSNRAGHGKGIYAVCTAHQMVLEAALRQGKKDGSPVLIEATANQVNQFGGYTGMTPADFVPYIESIAKKVGFPAADIILGGDHLGPVVWCEESALDAMAKARDLVASYVRAGFKKIHLDTSMACADDPIELDDELVARRAAELCEVAERTALECFAQSDLIYIVGTEVPPPGGATEAMDNLQVTPVSAVMKTVQAHKTEFLDRGLSDAWSRVVGLVVQPGVEFNHSSVHNYRSAESVNLSALIPDLPNMVYEAHSTDYQAPSAYLELVRDHFAILKVGPQLTFALREVLFALSHIEDALVAERQRSNLREQCELIMLENPKSWQRYYPSEEPQGQLCRRYSYSDRIRYYWNDPAIEGATAQLIANLEALDIPPPLLNQYLPQQYTALRAGELLSSPKSLIQHYIMQVTACYAAACLGAACLGE